MIIKKGEMKIVDNIQILGFCVVDLRFEDVSYDHILYQGSARDVL